jgi:hypothetical protein
LGGIAIRRAVEDHNDAELAIGRHAELVAELERLVAEHPFRERLCAQLMLSLYRSGRQAEALAAYRDARSVLVEELGLEPGRPLQQLEAAMLAQDASLDWSPPAVVAAATTPLPRRLDGPPSEPAFASSAARSHARAPHARAPRPQPQRSRGRALPAVRRGRRPAGRGGGRPPGAARDRRPALGRQADAAAA